MRAEPNTEFYKYLKEPYCTIYEIGVANGLRVSDILQLKKSSLKVDKPTIKEQKTGKSKRLYIPVKTRAKLNDMAAKSPNEYIFYSGKSATGHMTRQAVHKAFKAASAASHADCNISSHTMRKNYAQKQFKRHHSLNELKRKLNHSNVADSALYVV